LAIVICSPPNHLKYVRGGGKRKEEGGRKKEAGGRRKEEGGRRKEEGGRERREMVEGGGAARDYLSSSC
jgi:hypothetical protein